MTLTLLLPLESISGYRIPVQDRNKGLLSGANWRRSSTIISHKRTWNILPDMKSVVEKWRIFWEQPLYTRRVLNPLRKSNSAMLRPSSHMSLAIFLPEMQMSFLRIDCVWKTDRYLVYGLRVYIHYCLWADSGPTRSEKVLWSKFVYREWDIYLLYWLFRGLKVMHHLG